MASICAVQLDPQSALWVDPLDGIVFHDITGAGSGDLFVVHVLVEV